MGTPARLKTSMGTPARSQRVYVNHECSNPPLRCESTPTDLPALPLRTDSLIGLRSLRNLKVIDPLKLRDLARHNPNHAWVFVLLSNQNSLQPEILQAN